MQIRIQIKGGKTGKAVFGSPSASWWKVTGPQRLYFLLFINGKMFSGLLDTGTDIYAISVNQLSSRWPRAETITQLQGICGTQNP